MFQDVKWTRLSDFFLPVGEGGGFFPVEEALDQLGRAARDAAFIEAAEAIAEERVAQAAQMLAACQDELEYLDGAEAAELAVAVEGLHEDLDSLRATLPLERAFRADQRDAARTRIAAAQDRLARFLLAPENEPEAFDPVFSRDEAVVLARQALARAPDEIIAAARLEARARVRGAPIPDPEDGDYHLTQPEGWSAWLAAHLAAKAGAGWAH
ncbi:MAG: hypothetical protein R3D78_05605 [Paracoccaceae bacterium]|jgi:hypothetical protein